MLILYVNIICETAKYMLAAAKRYCTLTAKCSNFSANIVKKNQ